MNKITVVNKYKEPNHIYCGRGSVLGNPYVIKDKNKQAFYSLQENRKFDFNHLKVLKTKKYVEKITV